MPPSRQETPRQRPIFRYAGYVFSVGGGRLIGVLITSLTFPWLVRHLGVDVYGLWSYVIAVTAFLDNVANPGLSVYTAQQVAAHRREAFQLIPDVLALRFLASFVAVLVLLGISAFETRLDVRCLLLGFGGGLLFVNLFGSDYLLTALELFHARTLLTILQQSLYATGILFLVKRPSDIRWLPISLLVSAMVSSVGGWFVLWRHGVRVEWKIQPRRWRGILVPSTHYAGSSIMSNIYHRTGHVAVRWFLGEHALGLYAAAVRLVDIIRGFILVLLNVSMPRMALAAKSEIDMIRIARFAASVLALASVPLMFGLFTTAKLVVPLVLGGGYDGAVSLVRWTIPYLLTAPAASLLAGTILYAMGSYRAYLVSTAGGATAAIILYCALTPALGVRGAVLAFVLSEASVATIAYLYLPVAVRGLWRSSLILVAIGAGLLMALSVAGLARETSHLAVLVPFGAAVYGLAVFAMGKKQLFEMVGGSR